MNRTETERTCSSEGKLPGREAGSIPGSSTEKGQVRENSRAWVYGVFGNLPSGASVARRRRW
jgi:hypothetical protein